MFFNRISVLNLAYNSTNEIILLYSHVCVLDEGRWRPDDVAFVRF